MAHALPGLSNARLASSRLSPARRAGAGTGAGAGARAGAGAKAVAMCGDEDEELPAAVGCSGPWRVHALPELTNGRLASSRSDNNFWRPASWTKVSAPCGSAFPVRIVCDEYRVREFATPCILLTTFRLEVWRIHEPFPPHHGLCRGSLDREGHAARRTIARERPRRLEPQG